MLKAVEEAKRLMLTEMSEEGLAQETAPKGNVVAKVITQEVVPEEAASDSGSEKIDAEDELPK